MSACKKYARQLFECMKTKECMQNGGKFKECLKTNFDPECEVTLPLSLFSQPSTPSFLSLRCRLVS